MSKKYLTLTKYSQNTLTKENNQDTSLSTCLDCLHTDRSIHKHTKEDFSHEQYGAFSIRAAVRPPYSKCWGTSDSNCPKKTYPAVS